MRVKWTWVDRVRPEGEERDAESRLTRPVLVWVVAPGSRHERHVQENTLACEKVCVGAHWFCCLKMEPNAAASDPLLKDTGDRVPRFVFVSVDCEIVTVLDRRLSQTRFYRAMERTAQVCYRAEFDASVRKLVDVLYEFDRIARERKALAARTATEEGPEAKARRENARAALAERQRKAEAAWSRILDLTLKARTCAEARGQDPA